jgi:hypothetical protein
LNKTGGTQAKHHHKNSKDAANAGKGRKTGIGFRDEKRSNEQKNAQKDQKHGMCIWLNSVAPTTWSV